MPLYVVDPPSRIKFLRGPAVAVVDGDDGDVSVVGCDHREGKKQMRDIVRMFSLFLPPLMDVDADGKSGRRERRRRDGKFENG